MSELIIKSGKGEITLKKSKALVGLKTTGKKKISKQKYVDKEVINKLGGFSVVSLKTDDVDSKLDEIRGRKEIAVGTHVYYSESSKRPVIPTGEILISFESGVSEGEQKVVLDEFHMELKDRKNISNIVACVTSNSPNPIKAANAMQKLSLVRLAIPDLDTPLDEYDFQSPQDTLLPHQWHFKNDGFVIDANFNIKKGADAKVIDAWKRLGNTGSSKVVVALIDNGFDLKHSDLKDKVFKPFDLWNQSSEVTQGNPSYTHGTPCASIAVAASNKKGMVGVAPKAKFMPISGTSFSSRLTEQMFDYCVDNGADIISCSWGSTNPEHTLDFWKEEAIAKAAKEGRNGKGCIILFAAGNDELGYLNYYAAHPDVIAVGASTSRDEHAFYSNRGAELSVCAPSNGDWPLLAARAWWDKGFSDESGNFKFWRDGRSRGTDYKHFGGTSASTPLVAGICALMLSANPDLTAKEVKQILEQTADKIGHPSEYTNDHSNKYGYGRVNADKAIAEAIRKKDGAALPPPPLVEESIGSGRGIFEFSVKKQAPIGWGVQIGAFAEYGNVLIQVEKLQSKFGEKIIVNINELNGKTVYKVVVGAFSTKDEAKKLSSRMKAAGQNGFLRNLKDLQ